jgi:hypothetical protein
MSTQTAAIVAALSLSSSSSSAPLPSPSPPSSLSLPVSTLAGVSLVPISKSASVSVSSPPLVAGHLRVPSHGGHRRVPSATLPTNFPPLISLRELRRCAPRALRRTRSALKAFASLKTVHALLAPSSHLYPAISSGYLYIHSCSTNE